MPLAAGGARYAPAEQAAGAPRRDLERAVREFVTGVDEGEALIVLKTRSGHANALAVVLDEAAWPEVAGTVAGDDTVLVVLRRAADRERVQDILNALLGVD